MVAGKRRVVWDDAAKGYLKESIAYIRRDSMQNAEMIRNDIRALVSALPDHPLKYPADRYRLNNTGDYYRVLKAYGFRISYFVGNSEIRIVRIRHERQRPTLW